MENVLHAGMGGIEMSEWIEYTGSDEQLKNSIRSKQTWRHDYSSQWGNYALVYLRTLMNYLSTSIRERNTL